MADVTIKNVEILSDNKYVLKNFTIERKDSKGNWITQKREVYDRGNAATVLLYNIKKQTVLLTRQFRLPTYINGNPTGMLIEACAGLLEEDNPEDCVKREAEEEMGYTLQNVQKAFEAYMSAGGVTELLYFFTGTYSEKNHSGEGGGLEEEQEDIEVLELPFDKAFAMIKTGEIRDGKTIMLLQHAKLNRLFDVQQQSVQQAT